MNKKNLIITILLCIVFFALGTFFGLIIYDKYNAKYPADTENTNNEIFEEEKSLTKEEVLDKLTGEWGTCKNNSCYGIMVGKKDAKVYTYMPYLMWSDGFASGVVTDVTNEEKDVYNLTVYTAAYEGVESSGPEQINNYKINISEISENIIYIGDTKYQKITGDREEFYNAIK